MRLYDVLVHRVKTGMTAVLISLLLPVSAHAALVELRTGPAAAMAVHVETDWSRLNLFAGGGLALPGFIGSPLRHPSLTFGARLYTQADAAVRPYISTQYGWVMRTDGLEPFTGGGLGLAWHFGPDMAYRLTVETGLLLRNSWVPYPSAGLGLAVKL
ncbi:MAG TPA: hypothetical protein GXZ82_15135 [Firmicutes bacterium]|jgi:hypothetical protein|nr:hypothetical protein [Bacillota bacterium]